MDIDISDILASVSPPSVSPSLLDLQSLTRAFIAERVAPSLLPYPSALMTRVLARIAAQIELVEHETGKVDPRANFRLVVLQTEVERWKYLVRALLRARIAKLADYPLFYLEDAEVSGRLSAAERQYLGARQGLLGEHYAVAFLGQFPAGLRRLDDASGGVRMVDRPDEEAAVFVRCLRDIGPVRVEGTDTEADMRRGDVWVMRWSVVREWWENGDVELI
ncbi:GINS complex, Sld5 component [Eremomyces bilateralis CBS 781.70]|uniref:DNA replication complex GINS protein SLD5 n=1 Tax=Eremomyces bilateralis CBS 781.70 TaxID=1392243 RepID=A0A6G1FYI8_9PEZI|nr:GINS complex, Sld5 component [Eremomyces bilateralis CBS 781.70]KAF1810782.1 GINS complex, Sld5 component [Eremomyces bilateralis CBS 781.70]